MGGVCGYGNALAVGVSPAHASVDPLLVLANVVADEDPRLELAYAVTHSKLSLSLRMCSRVMFIRRPESPRM